MLSNWLSQIWLISAMNLRNIPQRWGSASVAIFGVACVVGVFVAVLSMASGFSRTMANAGSPNTVILMRAGSTSEMSSGLSYEQAQTLATLNGITREGDKILSSPELFVVVDIPKLATQSSANVSLRGVEPTAFLVRDTIELVEGRQFERGKNELIVGRSAQKQFANLAVGSEVKFGQTIWTVVGAFTANGGLAESELWCDAKILQAAYRRGNSYQTIRAKISSPSALQDLKDAMAAEPSLNLDAQLETDYLAEQAGPMNKFIKGIGYPLAILMALGAVFGAINTMYTSVASRSREIATLRAIGFGAFPVACSTLVESLALAVIGGSLGAGVVYGIFNGYTVSTLNFASFSQVVFDFAVTPALMQQGIVMAVVIGFIGGVFPAVRAARLPVAEALREV